MIREEEKEVTLKWVLQSSCLEAKLICLPKRELEIEIDRERERAVVREGEKEFLDAPLTSQYPGSPSTRADYM